LTSNFFWRLCKRIIAPVSLKDAQIKKQKGRSRNCYGLFGISKERFN